MTLSIIGRMNDQRPWLRRARRSKSVLLLTCQFWITGESVAGRLIQAVGYALGLCLISLDSFSCPTLSVCRRLLCSYRAAPCPATTRFTPFQSAALPLLQRVGKFRDEAGEKRSSSTRKVTKERESAGGEPRGRLEFLN